MPSVRAGAYRRLPDGDLRRRHLPPGGPAAANIGQVVEPDEPSEAGELERAAGGVFTPAARFRCALYVLLREWLLYMVRTAHIAVTW